MYTDIQLYIWLYRLFNYIFTASKPIIWGSSWRWPSTTSRIYVLFTPQIGRAGPLSLYIYIYIDIRIHTYLYTHTCVCMYIQLVMDQFNIEAQTSVCGGPVGETPGSMYACIYWFICLSMYLFTYLYIHVSRYLCIYELMHLLMYVFMYLCIYAFINYVFRYLCIYLCIDVFMYLGVHAFMNLCIVITILIV